jgi:hypothetical protein
MQAIVIPQLRWALALSLTGIYPGQEPASRLPAGTRAAAGRSVTLTIQQP